DGHVTGVQTCALPISFAGIDAHRECGPEPRLEALDVPQMVTRNEARLGTAFTVSVDAREGVTTGISAADRARTIRLLADPSTRSSEERRVGREGKYGR